MFKRTKTNLILHGIIMLAVGLICFLTPQGTLNTLAWVLGVLFILGGVLTFFLGRRGNEGISPLHLIAAILMAAVGIIIIVRPNIIAILVGLVILLEGIDFTLLAVRFRRADVKYWGLLLGLGILVTLLGLWAVLSPWVGATVLSIIIGTGCLCVSIDCFAALISIGRVENFLHGVKHTVTTSSEFQEAEVVETK